MTMTALQIMDKILTEPTGYFVQDNVSLWYSPISGWYIRIAENGTRNITEMLAKSLIADSLK